MRKRDKDLETWQCIYLLVKGEYAYDRDFHKSVQAISKRIGVDIRTVRERLKTGHKNRFRGEFFNLLNEAHFSFPDGTINQPTGRRDFVHGRFRAADPIRTETDLLTLERSTQ